MNRNDTTDIEAIHAAERIYHEWDEALGRKDIDAAMKLYAPDTVLESPLVRHLMGGAEGIVRGRDNLRDFVKLVFASAPALRRRHRKGFFTDGKRLMWEYPRAAPDGRALPAGELAKAAGITPQSASGHLRKMIEGGIVSVWSQGRFRYYRLADERVGAALETLATVAQTEPRRLAAIRAMPTPLRAARCCYTHIAGRLGVALADALVRCGIVAIEGDCVVLTGPGARWAEMTGFPSNTCRAGPGNLRLCLDWTERRFHFAGSLPSAILRYLLETRRLERGDQRSLIVTRLGKAWFKESGVDPEGSSSVEHRASALLSSRA